MSTNPVIAPPPEHNKDKETLLFLLGALGLFVILSLSLSIAATISGGNPSGGIMALVKPANWVAAFNNGFYPWRLVGASGSNPIVFFIALLFIWGLLGGMGWFAFVFIKGGPIHRGGNKVKKASLPSSSRWATIDDLKPLWQAGASKSRYAMQGVVLGVMPDKHGRNRVLRADAETSVLVIGPTRSGKTTGFIVPNLLEHKGPAVVTSTKYELIELTAGHRSKQGPIWIYDPAGELEEMHGVRSMAYSPMRGCRDANHAILTAQWLAQGLKSGGGGGGNDWEHWYAKAWNILAPCLYVGAHTNRNMKELRRWVFAGTWDQVSKECLKLPADAGREDILELIAAVSKIEAREKSSSFSTAQRVFEPFWNPNVVASSASNQFDPAEFLSGSGTLYLQTPSEKPEQVAPLFVALLETILVEAKKISKNLPGERLPQTLLLALDELANVCPIDGLGRIASEGAGRGIILVSILQDYAQLEKVYHNEEARTILNNHPAKLILPGISDPGTADLVVKLVGSGEITNVTTSTSTGQERTSGGGGGSRSLSVQDKPLLSNDKLAQQHDGTAYLIHRGLQPALISQLSYYLDDRLLSLTKIPFFPGFLKVTHAAEELVEDVEGDLGDWKNKLGLLGKSFGRMGARGQ